MCISDDVDIRVSAFRIDGQQIPSNYHISLLIARNPSFLCLSIVIFDLTQAHSDTRANVPWHPSILQLHGPNSKYTRLPGERQSFQQPHLVQVSIDGKFINLHVLTDIRQPELNRTLQIAIIYHSYISIAHREIFATFHTPTSKSLLLHRDGIYSSNLKSRRFRH